MFKNISFFFLIALLSACKTPRVSMGAGVDEFEFLDTLVVTAAKATPQKDLIGYRATSSKKFDLLHIDLDLVVEWDQNAVSGIAALSLKPYFYPQTELHLDAKNLSVSHIRMKGKDLVFTNTGKELIILLGQTYTKTDTLQLEIKYKAEVWKDKKQGPPFKKEYGFFINPEEDDPFPKSKQFWTQGETDYNSYWFPCIDSPNELVTNTLRVRVDNTFKSLSNGMLSTQIHHSDSTRTDVWVMNKPHAVYLIDLVIGQYHMSGETVNGVPYMYFVEPEFEGLEMDIFANTPEMVRFFSEMTGVPFPWQKYAQIPVRYFRAGAMENTTAVVFLDFIQRSKLELSDENNDGIIAHELFHHWFGNLVTSESWANLTLNEGFASYGEYLWYAYKYGFEKAEALRYSNLKNYLFNASFDAHPLIDFHYRHADDMFDGHSYDKGALVLHLLRNKIGDEAFFNGMNNYLSKHAHSEVEFAELRLAFEDVCGVDLNPFFNQWFLTTGHPELTINYSFSDSLLQLNVIQDQYQNRGYSLNEFPLEIQVYDSIGGFQQHTLHVSKEDENFEVLLENDFNSIEIDPNRLVLGTTNVNYSLRDHKAILKVAENPIARLESLNQIPSSSLEDQEFIRQVLKDPFFRIRLEALDWLDVKTEKNLIIAKSIAVDDPHYKVRTKAVNLLRSISDRNWEKDLSALLLKDPSKMVLMAGLDQLVEKDTVLAAKVATARLSERDIDWQVACFKAVAALNDPSSLSKMEAVLKDCSDGYLDALMKEYILFASELGLDARNEARNWIIKQIKDEKEKGYRYRVYIKYKQALI